MSGNRPPLVTLLLPGVLIVAYDGLVHYVSTAPDAAGWAAVVTLLPALALGLGLLAASVLWSRCSAASSRPSWAPCCGRPSRPSATI